MSIFDKLKDGHVIRFPSDYKVTEKRFRELCAEGVQAEQKAIAIISQTLEMRNHSKVKLKDIDL